ncbi:hypothetical protein Ob7_06618 [Thermosipho africanus Ob7]|uniref:hypothetical protein n=1 Tax=Thermosipho africanus TaxID=2421 RepID=UPI000E0A6341|nr:hypothetical protein [Thermosipho africanus]RDI91113.1 hypothetical protein Ob7_06618 [Thermosipho africanus Ob7]
MLYFAYHLREAEKITDSKIQPVKIINTNYTYNFPCGKVEVEGTKVSGILGITPEELKMSNKMTK